MKKTAVDFFGIPFEKRVSRSEFHLKNLGSNFDALRPSFSEFNGRNIEEYVDLVAKCGLKVWYTGMPHNPTTILDLGGGNANHYINDNKMGNNKELSRDFIDRFLERAHKNKIIVVQAFALFKLPGVIHQYPEWKTQNIDDGRELTKNKVPIQLKLGAAKVYDDVRMAAKCEPDSIYLDGMEGSTGAGPHIAAANTGIPGIAAIREARRALDDVGKTGKNPSVGCLVVKNNAVISSATTSINGRPHAEFNALNKNINFEDNIKTEILQKEISKKIPAFLGPLKDKVFFSTVERRRKSKLKKIKLEKINFNYKKNKILLSMMNH